ncbi:MAG: efflux RND transporter periplasmic adaptor subunit [Gammaproteobacteria bacterium]|nr:efflux RND transporter periplasmic adaptor subunit [Gammaproteobacteria bacterium]
MPDGARARGFPQFTGVRHHRVDQRGPRQRRGAWSDPVQLHASVEQAAVELAQARLDFGQRKVARTQELYRENFTSEYSVDEAVTEARLAEVELARARTILRQKTLRSPITGIVVERLAEVGEFVSDNEILNLVQLDPLHVEVVLPVERLDSVAVGTTATVYPAEPVGGEYEAEVTTVDQVIDAASGTFGVRLALPNPDGVLPAGAALHGPFHAGGEGGGGGGARARGGGGGGARSTRF